MADAFHPRFVDLVRNYTDTTGTQNLVLGGAVPGYTSFAAALTAGDRFYYSIQAVESAQAEVGRGTLQADGTISREAIGGTLTDFGVGTKTIALVAAAEWYATSHDRIRALDSIRADELPNSVIPDSVNNLVVMLNGHRTHFRRDPDQMVNTVLGQAAIDAGWQTEARVQQILSHIRIADAEGVYWIADDQAQELHLGHFGGVPDGGWTPGIANSVTGTNNYDALQDFIDWRTWFFEGDDPGRCRAIKIPAGVWRCDKKVMVDTANITIRGEGQSATILVGQGITNTSLYATAAAVGLTVSGLRIINNTAGSAGQAFHLWGENTRLEDVRFEFDPRNDNPLGYFEGDRLRAHNCAYYGGSDIMISGSDFDIDGIDHDGYGGDDTFVIKAHNGKVVENGRLANGVVRGGTSILAIGSDVGKQNADDPGLTTRVRNIQVSNIIGHNVARALFIKPGSLSLDFRDALVERVEMRDVTIHDEEGSKFNVAVDISVGRGSVVRDVYAQVTATCRAASQASRNAGLVVEARDILAGTNLPTIENVKVDLDLNDPCDANPNDALNPGYPAFDNAVAVIGDNDAASARIGRIEADVRVNGTRNSAFLIGPAVGGPVIVNRFTGTNLCNTPATASDKAPISAQSPIEMAGRYQASLSANVSNGRPVFADGSFGTVRHVLPVMEKRIGDVAATESMRKEILLVPRKGIYVSRVFVVTANDVPADDTNFVRFTVKGIGGSIIAIQPTSLTNGSAISKFTPLQIGGSSFYTGESALLPEDVPLWLLIEQFGGGQALDGLTVRIEFLEYA
jgi:hypothetical protein